MEPAWNVEPLLAYLDHPQATVRCRVIQSLHCLGNDRVIEALVTSLDDPEPEVVQAAIIALEGIAAVRPDMAPAESANITELIEAAAQRIGGS